MSANEDLDQRLARLADQTASLRPSPKFSERTMLAVQAEAALGSRLTLTRGARRFVPVALAFALGALSWAVVSEREATQSIATSFGSLELEW
jgi:hypothetical protein